MIQSSKLQAALGELEWKAFNELNDVSDYIWKSPGFLKHERSAEERKMAVYFPNGGETAELLQQLESMKLDETFPRLIAVANLFVALSVFESHVLLLLKVLQEHNMTAPKQELRHGIKRHLEATKVYGADPYGAQYHEQVSIAISIRNCLMHAKGLLVSSREARALKAQIVQRKYMSSEIRKKYTKRGESKDNHLVRIETSGLGEQLVITNEYSHVANSYLREYFRSLCGTLNPNTALRPVVELFAPEDLTVEATFEGPKIKGPIM